MADRAKLADRNKGEAVPLSEASSIAKFMGLADWRKVDALGLVEHITRGLPAKTADIVAFGIDPDGRFVRPTDIVPKSTLHRRKKASNLTQGESERVRALTKVFVGAMRLYGGDGAKAAQFLLNKHPMLDDRAPIDLAKESIAGADLVLTLIAKADAGIAA